MNALQITPMQVAARAGACVANDASAVRPPRKVSSYDLPTPEKRAFGARMRTVRVFADMSLTEAAIALGYSSPVQMSIFESGGRFPPTELIPKLATLYGTTTDYLFGLVEDSDRDPVAALQRGMALHLASAIREAVATTSIAAAAALRQDRPTAARVADFARRVVEAGDALAVMRLRCPGFDDLAGGARVVRLFADLAKDARDFIGTAARLERRLAATPVPTVAAAVAGLGLSDELLRARVGPFVQRPAPTQEAEDLEPTDIQP
jgi:transcriptional regulator with XRE-family HTH domain